MAAAAGVGAGAVGAAAGVGDGDDPDESRLCWVAREVYGAENPRWLMFRSWLVGSAPPTVREAYVAHGREFAAWIHDKPAVKAGVRFLMDRAIESHVAALQAGHPVTVPCRGSE